MGSNKGYRSIKQRFSSAIRRERKKKDRNISCISPWTSIITCCWFSSKKKMEEKKVSNENRSESHEQQQQQQQDEITESIHGGSSSSSLHCSGLSGQEREVSFNLGVGFGIIYLIVASKNELNKMVELSKEMETLLQHLKFSFQKDRYNSQPPNISSSSLSSSSEEESREHERQEQQHRYSLQTVENSDVVQNNLSMDMKGKGNEEKEMDQLEAELEVELQHLQVHLDSGEYITEISVEDSALHEESSNNECSELSFEEQPIFELGNSESELNLNYYYNNNNNDDIEKNNNNNYNNGVCPVELERKLQEVVAMRQEEKIKALESALDCAIQKLHQNQKELSWWKDTATLVFQKTAPH